MKLAEQVTFGGSGLDRAAHLRDAPDQLAELAAKGQAIALWRGKVLFDYDARALIRLASDHPLLAEATDPPYFLGLDGETGLFAYDVSPWDDPNADAEAMARFFDPSQNRYPGFGEAQVFCEVRGVMAKLSARDAELAASARGLMEWHRTHPFCARCGAATEPAQAGWQRTCPSCLAQHFPRTDPVVIVLVTDGDDLLLGRSPGWPEGMYSLLAGFMEPGETMEAAARREVFEESGIRIGRVDYLASQPWPFPASLMIGCKANALTRDIELDPKELEDARWFNRDEIFSATLGKNPDLFPARPGSIAHFLIHNWLSDTLE